MATYYIDPEVASTGTGTLSDPFKAWAYASTGANNSYLQKAGTITRESIPSALFGSNGITIGTYGGSNYATVSGFDVITTFTYDGTNDVWSKTVSNAWTVRMNGTPLSFVAWNTNIATTAASMTDGSFTYSGTVLYIKSSVNPNNQTVEASARQYCVNTGTAYSNLTFQGIHFLGCYRNGIQVGAKTGLTIDSCKFGMLGGELSGVYIGNQVEMYEGNSNILIQDCIFEDAFDSGISPQLRSTTAGSLTTATFRRNTIRRAGYAAIECTFNGSNQSMSGIDIYDNVMYDLGYNNWSGNRNGRGIMLSNNSLDTVNTMSGIVAYRNTIMNCRTGILSRDTAGENTFKQNIIDGCVYGLVVRQQVAASGHVANFTANVVKDASVAAHFVSGGNDGVHGSASATGTLTSAVYNNTFISSGTHFVNTTNANAAVTAKNNALKGGTGFNHSTGTLTETNNALEVTTNGKTLDSTDIAAAAMIDPRYRPTNKRFENGGANTGGNDLYGNAFPASPSIGAVQMVGVYPSGMLTDYESVGDKESFIRGRGRRR